MIDKRSVGFWLLLPLAAALLALAGCGRDSGGTVQGIHLVDAKALTVCTHLPYKPFQFSNEQGEVVGFDVDMLKLLADNLGVTEKIVSMDWSQITSGAVFAANKCDVAMGGATITPQRARAVQFSAPYFDATLALLVPQHSAVNGLGDLATQRLAVQTDTTGQIYADAHAAADGYRTVVFDDLALETTAVSAGKVDAAIGDTGPLRQYATDHPETRVSATFKTGEQYGFMARKNDANATKLIGRLNAVMASARNNGDYARLYRKWFHAAPPPAHAARAGHG